MGGRADERVAQRPQEACLVHGARGEGDRLLGGVLGGGHHRKAAHPRRLETLPLGGATIPPTITPIDGSSKSFRNGLFTQVRGSGILRSSPCRSSEKFSFVTGCVVA